MGLIFHTCRDNLTMRKYAKQYMSKPPSKLLSFEFFVNKLLSNSYKLVRPNYYKLKSEFWCKKYYV